MAKVDITLHGSNYAVTCGPGEESRLKEVVKFVDRKMAEIAKRATNASDSRLLLLACLTLADELIEIKRTGDTTRTGEEDLMVTAVEHLSQRVASIASRIGRA